MVSLLSYNFTSLESMFFAPQRFFVILSLHNKLIYEERERKTNPSWSLKLKLK